MMSKNTVTLLLKLALILVAIFSYPLLTKAEEIKAEKTLELIKYSAKKVAAT